MTIIDHLFSSWSRMKASKVSKSTTNNLRGWLERPSTSTSVKLSNDAKEDLDWLKKYNKDLSSLSVDSNEKGWMRESSRETGGSGGGAVADGKKRFLEFFGGCAGRRNG
jgi:hypothetical protein